MSRNLWPLFIVGAFLATPFLLRADDELDRIRGIQNLAAQKLTSQVNEAIALSRKQEKIDPLDAKTTLQDMLRRIRNSRDLNDEQSTRLERQLQTRLTDIDNLITRRRIEQDQKTGAEKPKSRPANEPPATGSISSAAKEFQNSAKGALNVAQETIREREKNIVRINSNIERTPHYPTDDQPIVFPKDWAKKKPFGPQLTAKEVALLKALNSVMSVSYDNDKLRTVIDHIQDRTGLSIIIDDASMKEAMVEYDDPITFKVNKVTVRTILKKVLGDKGLTYAIKEGTIHVMTPKKAAEMVVVRSYPVDDLISTAGPMQFNPFFQRFQMLNNAQQLINLLQSSTDPAYWQPNGPGSITFHEPTRSLVVRASAEMHYQLGAPGIFGR